MAVGMAEVFETGEASKDFCPVVPWLGIYTYVVGREREVEFPQSGHHSYNSRIARDFMLRKHAEVQTCTCCTQKSFYLFRNDILEDEAPIY